MTGTRRWLFADQLGPHRLDAADQPVLLVASRAVLRRRRFHRQKAHLVLSALRHRAAEMGEQAVLLRTGTCREALERHGEPVDDGLTGADSTRCASRQSRTSAPAYADVSGKGRTRPR
jgi:deoxyribodipyrimidine photolyase-like uncharacterized protein